MCGADETGPAKQRPAPPEEAFYVIEGSVVQAPGGPPIAREPGSNGVHLRDVPHGGYKAVGDTTLKLLAVHIIDKGKPFPEPAD